MLRTLLALGLALSLSGIDAAQAQSSGFSTLEERMSAADFRRAGLEKLSAEELAALNAWLQKDAGQRPVAAATAGGDRLGFEDAERASNGDGPITSRLVGESTGFSYGTTFKLENGQVWRSTDRNSRLTGVRLSNPGVEIRKGIMGNWRLKLDGYNTTVNVERVE